MENNMNPSTARKDWERWREELRSNALERDTHLQSLLHVYRPNWDRAVWPRWR